MRELITQTWAWWFSGAMIASIMFFLLYFRPQPNYDLNQNFVFLGRNILLKDSGSMMT
jgi:hypothetical protein